MPAMDPALDAALTEALLLARRGDAAATAVLVTRIRTEFNVTGAVEPMVRLMIAEGISLIYEGRQDRARDRLWRAQQLALVGASVAVRAIAQSWMAFLHYEANEFGQCAANAFAVLQAEGETPLHARARAASVLGCAYQFCEATVDAKAWFSASRNWSTTDGDALMTSSTIFNMAALRFSAARLRYVCGSGEETLDSTDLLFLSSSETYDFLKGYSVRGYLHALMRAFAASCRREFSDATRGLEEYLRSTSNQDERSNVLALAELSWCKLKLSSTDQALISAQGAAARISSTTDLDDRAVAHRRLADVFAACGDAAAAAFHAEASKTALAGFREHQRVTREMLDAYGVSPPAL